MAIFPNVCLWWRSFFAQTSQLLTPKNCILPLHMPGRFMLLHRMALVFIRLFCFGANGLPPPPPTPPPPPPRPLQKIARTPKQSWKTNKKMKTPGRHFHIWSPYKGEFLAVPEKWSTHNSMLCELCWFQDEYCLKQGYLASKISASAQQQTNERCRISQL